MHAYEAGTLLTRLARGGEVDLAPGEEAILEALVRDGLVTPAPDVSAEAAELEATRRELTLLAAPGAARDPATAQRVPALRARALALVDATSKAQGAAVVRGAGMGPYRAGGAALSYVVTYAARALLADLAPRLGRVGRMSLAEFRAHMGVLRDVLSHRVLRARSLQTLMRETPAASRASDAAVRSAAVGLASRREPERELAATWGVVIETLTRADASDGSGASEWFQEQEAAAAEGLMLATRDLATLTSASVGQAHALRLEILRRYSGGHTEDALDAAIMLGGSLAGVSEAEAIARAARDLGMALPLSAALVLRASRAPDPTGLAAQVRARFAALGEGQTEHERTYAAVLLCLAGIDPASLVDRARDLRAYLSRFAAQGTLVPAALLALLPIDLPELLDLLRLVSAELQKHRFGVAGAESVTLSIKLLLATALLAQGEEGDPEERAGWLRFDPLAASQLGVAGLASQVPLSLSALTAFHRPTLDAVAYQDSVLQPTHSPYVFGRSHRSSSWG